MPDDKEGNPKGKSAPVPGAPKRRPATVARYSRHKTPSPAPSVPATMAPQPTFAAKTGIQPDVFKYLAKVQNYINQLGYQRVGEPKIIINARLSMKMQMFTAREIIQKGLPIKCLHAVVVAVNFTNCLSGVERFPIYFRSHVGGREYKHIVLGVYFHGHFGALGISRDSGLQDKAISYAKLSDLIFEFAKCYGQSGHILNEIKFGNVITHEQYSLENLFSKKYVVPIAGCHHNDIERNVEKFSKQLRSEMGTGSIKPPRADALPSVHNIQNSRLSRSKTSANLTGTSRTSVRSRALSVGAGASSFANSKKIDDSPKKLTIPPSKPGKTGRPNK